MDNKQVKKETKRREKYERLKRKDYSKDYLRQQQLRKESPNIYPMTRLVLIKDFFKAKDLYMAMGLFIASQISIMLIASGTKNETIATVLNVIAVVIGAICMALSISIINKRQKHDSSRRKVRIKHIFLSIAFTMIGITIVGIISGKMNIVSPHQPNQEAINNLMTSFPLAMLFSLIFVAPIVEETIFRELLPHATGPSYISFIGSSLLFIIIHIPSGIAGWATYAIITTAFLSARLIGNNVYTGIIVHMIWNTLSALLLFAS